MPQSASDTPFRIPVPAMSHFALLGFKPERSQKLSKAFIASISESSSLTKNVVYHRRKQNIRIYC